MTENHDAENTKDKKKRRYRLTDYQKSFLEAHFAKNCHWSFKKTHELATELGFQYRRVYKWHYDRMRYSYELE